MTSMGEQSMVDCQYYDPEQIFRDNTNPQGMAGETNKTLAVSFYNSRQKSAESHNCKNAEGHDRYMQVDRNAGAVQLINKDTMSIYDIPGNEGKEYHFISFGNKEFEYYIYPAKRSSYGHSERILMRDILDDLIFADKPDNHDILRPSDNLNCKSPPRDQHENMYEVLKNLTENTGKYKKYLESKKIIVKMWSERPPCTRAPRKGVGGDCNTFISNIFPDGSQFGYTVKDYIQEEDNQNGAPKIVEAIDKLKRAYKDYFNIVM